MLSGTLYWLNAFRFQIWTLNFIFEVQGNVFLLNHSPDNSAMAYQKPKIELSLLIYLKYNLSFKYELLF
jgi:hypothetical protein